MIHAYYLGYGLPQQSICVCKSALQMTLTCTTQFSSELRGQYKAKAYAAVSAKSPLDPTMIPRHDPGDEDVQIEILFCGIYHSDLHQVRNEWSTMPTVYPLALRSRT